MSLYILFQNNKIFLLDLLVVSKHIQTPNHVLYCKKLKNINQNITYPREFTGSLDII